MGYADQTVSRMLILAILCLLLLPDASNAFRNRVTAGLRIGDSDFFCNYDRLTYIDATNRCRDHCTYQRANEKSRLWWQTSKDIFWLGGMKERNGNYFVWNDGENCIAGLHGLDDEHCSVKRFYVCEKRN